MLKIEGLEPGILFSEAVKDTVISRLTAYVQCCGPSYPGYSSSFELLQKLSGSGIIDRSIKSERETNHNPFSHSLVTSWFSAHLGEQLNVMSGTAVGLRIVDLPLLTTATFAHDIGDLIKPEDVVNWGLLNTNFRPLFINHPVMKKNPRVDEESFINNTHIARTVAWLLTNGFDDHAQAAAHGLYNLMEDKNIPIERWILMIADLCVKDGIDKRQFPNAGVVNSIFDRAIDAYDRHGGDRNEYLRQVELMQTAKAVLTESGIKFPPYHDEPSQIYLDEEELHQNFARLLRYFNVYNISRRHITVE
jgi:hypothetical protein